MTLQLLIYKSFKNKGLISERQIISFTGGYKIIAGNMSI